MCTSLTFSTIDGTHLLSRTLDLYYNFYPSVCIIPRKYQWFNTAMLKDIKNKYAVLCMADTESDYPLAIDGVNEMGVMGASLALTESSSYPNYNSPNKYNIRPGDFLSWVLGNFKSIDEIEKSINNINIVATKDTNNNFSTPLHWIFSDKTGNSLIIESINNKLEIYTDTNGVMTNSPSLPWHLINLHQYIGLSNKSPNNTSWNGIKLTNLGSGNGSFGMPGDFSSISRFIRASFLKNFLTPVGTELDGITAVFHILNNCSLPIGSVIVENGGESKTIYSSAMCAESGNYYYKTYNNSQITVINLFKENLNGKTIISFPTRQNQQLFREN